MSFTDFGSFHGHLCVNERSKIFHGNHYTVCYYYVTYEFQSESTPYSVNVKELLAHSRRHI